MSLIESLRQFDLRQGKDPIDPTRIEGFGAGAPPAPAPPVEGPPILSAREAYGDPVEPPEEPGEPVSPLIAAALAPPAAPEVPSEPVARGGPAVPNAELIVVDGAASYRERPVQLTKPEQAQIAKVILKAIRRSLDEQYQELTGTRPRARRKGSSEPVSPSSPATPAPRRVRRKSLLKDGAA